MPPQGRAHALGRGARLDEDWIPIEDGVRLHIRRWTPDGSAAAPEFLLVHGLSSNARLWDAVAVHLARAGHVSTAIDLRSHGRSDAPEKLSLAGLAERIGVSKARADQLLKTARTTKEEEPNG
jgi:alpha-beta hydrolase superfamily lysophospholipase